MCLKFEADRRALNITLNSFNTELASNKDDRFKLYPTIGMFWPEGLLMLRECEDAEQVERLITFFPGYAQLFENVGDGPGDKTFEDRCFEYEAKVNEASFDQQFHYGIFYSIIKLKEQEARNIVWISECIAQNHKAKIDNVRVCYFSLVTRAVGGVQYAVCSVCALPVVFLCLTLTIVLCCHCIAVHPTICRKGLSLYLLRPR